MYELYEWKLPEGKVAFVSKAHNAVEEPVGRRYSEALTALGGHATEVEYSLHGQSITYVILIDRAIRRRLR